VSKADGKVLVAGAAGVQGAIARKDWDALGILIADSNADVTVLDLYAKGLGDHGAARLAAALETNTSLTELDLRGNGIGAIGARFLAAALDKNRTLATLGLGGNHIGEEGVAYVATALENNSTLTKLSLYSAHPASLRWRVFAQTPPRTERASSRRGRRHGHQQRAARTHRSGT
jgi:hypothetical protein